MHPRVTIAFAQSIDGKIATKSGASRYISDEAGLQLNQELRRDHGAILVGIGTVLSDDPLLTCRVAPHANPLRVIVDPYLRLPLDSAIVQSASRVATLLFCTQSDEAHPQSNRAQLAERGVEIIGLSDTPSHRIDLSQMLSVLSQRAIDTLMVEGGAKIITSFIRENLWDDMVIITAAKIIGDGVSAVGDLNIRDMDDVVHPRVSSVEIMGHEVVWRFVNNNDARRAVEAPRRESMTLFFVAPRRVRVRPTPLRARSRSHTLFVSRVMAISAGTERQLYLGNFTPHPSDPRIDCVETNFEYPFRYGYINVLERDSRRYFGFLPHAEHHYADPASLIALPPDIDDTTALCIPHTETALSIVHDSDIKVGDRVLVVGAGVVGTLTARILGACSGANVTVVDTNAHKARWFPPGQLCSDRSDPALEGRFDCCIEISGAAAGLQYCLQKVADEGRITVASWYGDREIALNLGADFHRRRLTLRSSQVSTMSPQRGSEWNKRRRMDLVLEILSQIETADLVTHRFPFSEASAAYALLEGTELYGLIVLEPGK